MASVSLKPGPTPIISFLCNPPHPTLTSKAQIPFSISVFAAEKPEVTIQMGNYSKFGIKGRSGLPVNDLFWLFIGSFMSSSEAKFCSELGKSDPMKAQEGAGSYPETPPEAFGNTLDLILYTLAQGLDVLDGK